MYFIREINLDLIDFEIILIIGQSGIRTHGTIGTLAFKTSTFDHSVICPELLILNKLTKLLLP